ncbi:hypothetical protein L195_g048389, partial [Trifolium pratense]
MSSLTIDVSTNSANFVTRSLVVPNYHLIRDFQPMSHIHEHPPPPNPPDRVVIRTSSLNFSPLVTTEKHFSMLQTCLQLFDEMPKCHIAVWSVIINRCMDNEQAVEFDLSKELNRMHIFLVDFYSNTCSQLDSISHPVVREVISDHNRVVALLILHLHDYFVEGSATSTPIYH